MEYGLIANINQYADNKSLEIQKVQSSNETSKIDSKSQLAQLQEQAIEKQKEVSQAKKIQNQSNTSQYEVVLSNTNFGYNDDSKDFYVKVSRGDTENQYPTESMMRLKAYMLSLNSAS